MTLPVPGLPIFCVQVIVSREVAVQCVDSFDYSLEHRKLTVQFPYVNLINLFGVCKVEPLQSHHHRLVQEKVMNLVGVEHNPITYNVHNYHS